MRPLGIGVACFATFGGSGILATELGIALARRGHRVHFLCAERPFRLARSDENVTFHPVEWPEYPLFADTAGAGQGYPIALASLLVEVARREQLDVLHVHYAVPHATSAQLARQLLADDGARVPRLVTTLHGTDTTLVGKHPSFRPIVRWSVRSSDAVTVPSTWLRDETRAALALPDLPIEVIPNFVDTDVYHPAVTTPSLHDVALAHLFHEPVTVDDRRPLVLAHCSNFRPLKRVADTLYALAAVRAHRPAKLILVGDGPDRADAERLAFDLSLGPHVAFVGARHDVADLLRLADIFLLPSAAESFGLAALEALACGLPVVAADTGGLPEVVTHGRTGVLVPVGDVPGIARAVLALADDPTRREAMAAACRDTATIRFGRDAIVTRYEQILTPPGA